MTRFVALGDVCSFVGGGTPSRKRPEFFDGDIPWATVKDFKKLTIDCTEEHITDQAVRDSATNIVERGSVLLVTRVGLGKVAIAGTQLAINQDIKAVKPHPDIEPSFLFWFLLSRAEHIKTMGAGATVKGVTLNDIRAIQFPVLSLPEQRRIVDLLSRAEGIVRLRRDAQSKTAELVPALFLETFGAPGSNPKGWPTSNLGSVLDACDYGTSKKSSANGAGVPVIRMGNVTYAGDLVLSDVKHVELDPKELAKQALMAGDLLFNRTNSRDLVGKSGLWDGRYDAVAASYFIRMRVDRDHLTPEYLWAFMNSGFMKRRLFDTARGAIGQANINSKELKAFPIALPPLPLQRDFVERVEQIQSLAKIQEDAMIKAQATFNVLLHRAFLP